VTTADLTDPVFEFALRMGDNCLILAQRVGAWCGHAPVLEEDIALANTALDLIGQTKLWLGLAGELEGAGRSADDLAFLRDSRDFRNCLLVEQPNGDFGQTLMRQFLFDAWHHPMLKALTQSGDARVAEIAEKAVKEAAYHLDRSHDLVVRLGDGSAESHGRMQSALDALWPFTDELTSADEAEQAAAEAGAAPDFRSLQPRWEATVRAAFADGALSPPEDVFMRTGGKAGLHSEAFDYLVGEMQMLQRTHPGARW